jgi:NAD(P)-dependent dehydrogenase (short-subunit alcohol dehydrogenase family)
MSRRAAIRDALTQIYPPRPTFTETNILPGSESGRVFIVTGGNAGIGFEICKILYASGATIYMAARNKASPKRYQVIPNLLITSKIQSKAEKAIKTITESLSKSIKTNGQIKFLSLDLNDILSVKAAAESFVQQESKLDVLWNNAGAGGNAIEAGQRTAQGFEPMVGMHCIATLLFTKLLLPQLRAAAATGISGRTRVIWTSSNMAEFASPPNGIDFDVLEKGSDDRLRNYGTSKAGTWILSREFARRHTKDGIVSVCLNPGYLKAGSFAGTPRIQMIFFNALILHEPIFGAYTQLHAGLSSDLTLQNNGAYLIPWGRIRADAAVPRQDLIKAMTPVEKGGLGYGEKFWTWCEDQWEKFV